MGARVKEIKKTTPKLTLGVVSGLTRLMPQFNCKSYADHQRISEVLKTLSQSGEQQKQIIQDFFKANFLPDTESISGDHPLAQSLFAQINNAETTISKTDVSTFSPEELNQALDGLKLSFADRDFLMFWLLK